MTTLTAPQSAAQDNPSGGRLTPLRRRLRRVSGHVLGIERMLSENRSCEDVLIQLAAVQGALRAAAQQVLACHLAQSVEAVATGSLPATTAAEQAAYLSGLLSGIPAPRSSPTPPSGSEQDSGRGSPPGRGHGNERSTPTDPGSEGNADQCDAVSPIDDAGADSASDDQHGERNSWGLPGHPDSSAAPI